MATPAFVRGQNVKMDELKKTKLPSNLSRIVVNSPTFEGFIISGNRQMGKSMYMLQQLYFLNNRNWDKAFEVIFFSMEQFTDYLKEVLDSEVRVPVVAVDDAGFHMGAQQYNIHRNQVAYISNLLDVIGIISKSILFTLPVKSNLIKTIRMSNFYDVEIHLGRHKYDRQAIGYLHPALPDGKQYTKKIFIDKFDVRVPDHIYQKYSALRKKYSVEALQDMEAAFGQKKGNVFTEGDKKYAVIDVA